ncbi:MAG: hypothetical protein ACOCRO_05700 [Halanaerobiales bacterium]
MKPHNIIIGNLLVSEEELGIEDFENTVKDEELFLPKLLKNYGFFKSTSEVRKNRPDLWKELKPLSIESIQIGKNKLFIAVGKID